MFAVGDGCEVAGAADDGFADCWFVGVVAKVWHKASKLAVSDTLEIAYPDFVTTAGKSKKQTVSTDQHPARSMRVRPPLPPGLVPTTLAEYQVSAMACAAGRTRQRGHQVCFEPAAGARWRQRRRQVWLSAHPTLLLLPCYAQVGEAVDVLENAVWWHAVVCDRSATQGLQLYLAGSQEQMWVGEPTRLRPGKVYVAGQWRDRPLPRLPKGLVRRPAATPQQAQQQQQQQAAAKPAAKGGAAPASAAVGKPGSGAAAAAGSDEFATTVLVRRSAREKESRVIMVSKLVSILPLVVCPPFAWGWVLPHMGASMRCPTLCAVLHCPGLPCAAACRWMASLCCGSTCMSSSQGSAQCLIRSLTVSVLCLLLGAASSPFP